MSLSFYLYRAAGDAGPMMFWEENHAQALGSVDQVKAHITALFPDIRWSQPDLGPRLWTGMGPNRLDDVYLDLCLMPLEGENPGGTEQVFFVVGRKTGPSVMRKLMEGMDLNHVCCPDTGDMVDPYAYTDDDPYYAIKPQA